MTSPSRRPGIDYMPALHEGHRLLRRARLTAWAATVASAAVVAGAGFGVRAAVHAADVPDESSTTTTTAAAPTPAVPTKFGQFAEGLAFQSFIFSHDGEVVTLDATAEADSWNNIMFTPEPDESGNRGFTVATRCDAVATLLPPPELRGLSDDELVDVIRELGCKESYDFVGTRYVVDGQLDDYTFALEGEHYRLSGTFRIHVYRQMHQGWNGVTLEALPARNVGS